MGVLHQVTVLCNGTIEGEGMDCEESLTRTYDDNQLFVQMSRLARADARARGWGVRSAHGYPFMGSETEVELCPKHLLAYDAPGAKPA